MKAIRLFLAAALVTTTFAVSARDYLKDVVRDGRSKRQSVLFIFDEDAQQREQEIYQFDSPEKMKIHLLEKERESRLAKRYAIDAFYETTRTGYQSNAQPLLIFTQKSNKFTFGVGGFINLRTSYDFNGVVENVDFIPADIPTQGSYNTRQQLMMDGSTSRIYFKALANTRALGQVEIFVDMDFRGGTGYNESGVVNSYTPRLRTAYASFFGFTIGRDVTTFCDLDAAPRTVDFQGPNAYSFNYATVLRYERSCLDDRLQAGIALEQPNVSGTYTTESGDAYFAPIPQRVPDVPMYVEYKMGAERQHHFRVSAVLRDMYIYDMTQMENTTLLGWGVKASGNLQPYKWIDIYFNGTYGKGITPYIQDLNDSGLDFTPSPMYSTTVQTMPMYAWQAAATLNFTERLSGTGGYSMACVEKEEGYYSESEYKKGQYVFGNLFYDVTPRFTVACEFLYGSRRDMGGAYNTAHRASIMGQFAF